MPIEVGPIAPWLDNWAIQRQLWQPGAKTPGTELLLSPTNRGLMVQWRDNETSEVVFASSELQSNPAITIVNAARGVVEIALSGTQWNVFREDGTYNCEIIAYGYLYDSFPFDTSLPMAGVEQLNGAEMYGSPRQILEIIGQIPGASVQIGADLSGDWTLNSQGYWQKSIPKAQALFGLFVNDLHAKQVEYADLALRADRQWARVAGSTDTDTLYYKGTEQLDSTSNPVHVETAYNRYVLRCLQQASTDLERITGASFHKQRVFREVHQGTYHQQQITARVHPVLVDRYFRLDCYSQTRSLVRRYTELNVFRRDLMRSQLGGDDQLFIEGETGMITLTQSFYDWVGWDNDNLGVGGLKAYSYLTPGNASLELTYTGGYDYPPADISEAAALLAAIRQATFWQQALTQGMSGLSLGCVNLNFSEMFTKYTPVWQQQAQAILGSYQRFEVQIF